MEFEKLELTHNLKTARHSWVAVWKLYSALSWNYTVTDPGMVGACRDCRTAETRPLPLFWKSIFRSFTCFSLLITRRKKKTFNLIPQNVAWMKEGGEEGHEGQREGQELHNKMCSHNLDLETTTQTFMLHARPSPLCASASVKHSPHCPYFAPEISLRLLCAHASSYDYMPFCCHMSACVINQ